MDKKILVIADLHGLNVWKKMVSDEFHRIIFLGDYVDSFIVPDSHMLGNLQDILEYKRANMDRVILLLGNHDIQYFNEGCGCSGYRPSIAGPLKLLYSEAEREGLFKIVHEEGGYLFSHAGLDDRWQNDNKRTIVKYTESYEAYNEIFQSRDKSILFQCSGSKGGSDKYSGPIWADKDDTTHYGVMPDVTQVVGHTKVPKKVILPHIIYCDTLEHGDGEPLILEL